MNRPIGQSAEKLQALLESLGARNEHSAADTLSDHNVEELEDYSLAQLAFEDTGKLGRLFRGDWEGQEYPSQSEADLALTIMLARLSSSDKVCWAAFQISPLGKRAKASRMDYAQSTMAQARAVVEREKHQIQVGQDIATRLHSVKVSKDHFMVLRDEDLMHLPKQSWIVKRIIPDQGIGAIYGPSGSCKSFLVLDLLAHIANGEEWFGHRVTSVPTTYVPLEGQGGIPKRVEAWRKAMELRNGCPVDSNVGYITDRINLREAADRDKLVTTLKERNLAGGVLTIDTLAQAAQGLEENSSEGMGEMIAIFQELQHRLGGVVLVVHHSGKEVQRGMRGWSGLPAAMDFAIECKLGVGKLDRKFALTKVKDDECGKEFDFTMTRISLGHDDDGDEISSLCVTPSIPMYAPTLSPEQERAEDDEFILNWIQKRVADGFKPTRRTLDAERTQMRHLRSMTQSKVRLAVTRLLEVGRLTSEGGERNSPNSWLRPVAFAAAVSSA